MKKFWIFLSLIFTTSLSFGACTTSQIDIAGDGTNCIDTKFSVTTTSLSRTDEFKFNIAASGTFYVDCGDGGMLGSDNNDVSNKTISRMNTSNVLYTCTYETSGAKIIRFAGTATSYNASFDIGSIDFSTNATPKKIFTIDGSLSTIFPQLEYSSAGSPSFRSTFKGASALISVPSGLFSNIRIYKNGTFERSFESCSSLSRIPSGMLFNVTGGVDWAFAMMFYACSSLTEIPSDLFSGSGGGPYAFYQTFRNCESLTTIPDGLFANVKTPYVALFQDTFWNCRRLSYIPDDLFSGITTGASDMFNGTFKGCYSLSSLPSNLFSNIHTSAEELFYLTFSSSGLSGPIPPSLFSGLIANNSPTATDMWTDTFRNTNLDTTCPSGTTQYITGYESYWGGRVSCVDESFTCDAGEYFPAHGYQCETCPKNSYCAGGNYNYSESTTQGISGQCANGYSAPAGSSSASDCTANTITVRWDDGNGGAYTTTCSYGGTLYTPTTAPVAPKGHHFTGWTFNLVN